jgi:hypothetical protein
MAEQGEDLKLTDAMVQGLEYGFPERRRALWPPHAAPEGR